LRDHAAQRVTNQVDPVDLQLVEEGDRVAGHLRDGERDVAGRESDAGVVEEDHFPMCGDATSSVCFPPVERCRERCRSGRQARCG